MEAIKEIGIKKSIKYVFFSLWQYMFFLMFISPLRVFLLRLSGVKVGKDTVIERISLMNLYSNGLSNLTIGNRCFLGDGIVLDLANKIVLEDDVTLSAGSFVLTHTNVGYKKHPLQKKIQRMKKGVIFKKGVFVGIRAVIMPGIVVGAGSAIGSAALVNKSVGKSSLVAGIPAKKIKKLS